MRYTGTVPKPGPTPDTRRCRIKNRAAWCIVSAVDAELLRPFELFMDRTDKVLCQNVLGKKLPLVYPHTIELVLASTRTVVE